MAAHLAGAWNEQHGPAARPKAVLCTDDVPYPSAEGLHVGNLFAFTGNDIYGRFQRLMGHNVFEPLGYDAFGIHSENYALKVGVHPMDLIPRNIANFRRQLERAGLMVDWRYTLSTTEPNYYKWTQWLFLQLFEQGLAYKKQAAVNWCPKDKTVLANEQVVGGHCERCGTPVEQRLLEQWFFRISDYAPRLLENLDHIDWSETTKTAQRNWIGRSEGAEIAFATHTVEGGECEIRVFTTRADTIYGATYMVLAPEHPLVKSLTKPEQEEEGRSVPREDEEAGHHHAQDEHGEDRGLHWLVRDQSSHRQGDPDLDLRLRADGVRHRRDHGRARPR